MGMVGDRKEMVDYKRLLWKYLNHVGECEGVTFLPVMKANGDGWGNVSGIEFTADEAAALEELNDMERPVRRSESEK